ncbi:cation-dependent mannose-6-phosphate receptor-like [Crassostrea virginica]
MSCLDFLWTSLILSMCTIGSFQSGCEFPLHKTPPDFQERIQPLLGKTFFGTSSTTGDTFYFGVCTTSANTPELQKYPSYGLMQETTEIDKKQFYKIGKYTNASVIQGSDWLILEYLDGEPYRGHCGSEPRKGRVLLTCDGSVKIGEELLVVLEEERNKTQDCFYLFEMRTSAVCVQGSTPSGLSIGSILLIVFLCVVSLYLILGCAYMRFVLHAKGKDQCPNYEFWQDFGNLQADGCNLVCRTNSPTASRSYKGIGDDQLEGDDDKDDHLLPM